MPFYEYECTACKFYVEALQKVSEPPLKQCPSCKKQTMKRLVSAPVFRLKGGGWYETDFKSEGEQKRNLHGPEEAAESKVDDAAKKPEPVKAEASKPSEAAEKKPARKAAATKPAAKKASKPVPKAAKRKTGKKSSRR
jgi:putative FmdB family regulatory protein